MHLHKFVIPGHAHLRFRAIAVVPCSTTTKLTSEGSTEPMHPLNLSTAFQYVHLVCHICTIMFRQGCQLTRLHSYLTTVLRLPD